MIPITSEWQIVIEPTYFTLQNKKVKGADEKSLSRLLDASKAGEEYWVDVGYFMDMEHALKRFTQSEMAKAKDVHDLKIRMAELSRIIKDVQKLFEIVPEDDIA
jgi:hypothetical protein